jgi:hypothetical protein
MKTQRNAVKTRGTTRAKNDTESLKTSIVNNTVRTRHLRKAKTPGSTEAKNDLFESLKTILAGSAAL